MWSSSSLDRQKVEELIEAREVLESQLSAWAAVRATSAQIEDLKSIVVKMEDSIHDASAFMNADVDLHLTVAEAATNRYFLRTMSNIRTTLRRDIELSTEVGIRRHGNLAHAARKHRRLVDAIERHEPDAAREAMLEIIDENRAFVIGMYDHAPSAS
jgi:DNA-binding FadR family transcriptional regulator